MAAAIELERSEDLGRSHFELERSKALAAADELAVGKTLGRSL